MYDGDSMTSQKIGEYYDDLIPPDIITTNNKIFVHFLTDFWLVDIGFKLMYNPARNQL